MLKDANKISKTRIFTINLLEKFNIYGFKDAFLFILKNIVPFFVAKSYVFNAAMSSSDLRPGLIEGEPSAVIATYVVTIFGYLGIRAVILVIETMFE